MTFSKPRSSLPSASATPAPPSLSEQLSFHAAPRPFKNAEFAARMARISSNLSRRNKSLKQMLQAEQEAAMRAAGSKFRERRKKDASAQKSKLVGAALKAFSRREERERVVAAAAAPENEDEADTPDDSAQAVDQEDDADNSTPILQQAKREIPTYASVEAPPSLRPAKKYCDVTGLIAPYTDPKSGLRYHSVEVYEIIKQFGPGVDNAYLSVRGNASQIM